MVKESTAVSKVNIPQLVGREDGTVEVPTYDWQSFLSPAYKPLLGIKPMGHFQFSSNHPGKVFYKLTLADAEEEKILVVQHQVARLPPMPNVLPCPGLSRDRQLYLYQSIREYVREDHRDVVCPLPNH